MRPFTCEEDATLMNLFALNGPRWKLIAAEMGSVNPRSAAMVRNRWLRVQKGKQRAEQGLSKNKCGLCGQIKQGHICAARLANATATIAAQQSANQERASQILSGAADINLPPLASSSIALELGSPQPLALTMNDQENIATSSSQLIMSAAGAIACDSSLRAPPLAAASLAWSPQTSPAMGTSSPGISAASLAASLLAPTPEGMGYTFPVAMAELSASKVLSTGGD